MVSYNTVLTFYRSFLPEEEARKEAKRYMEMQHKYYRGKHERNTEI